MMNLLPKLVTFFICISLALFFHPTFPVVPLDRINPPASLYNVRLSTPVTSAHLRARNKASASRVLQFCKTYVSGFGGTTTMHEILTILSVLDAPIDFLDVGANTGKTSLPVIFCMHPKHRVLAVEPIEKNINSLLHSRDTLLAMNATESDASDEAGRLVVEKIALSDRAANGHMFFPASRGDNAALNRQASTIVFKDDVRRESVRMETADAFLKRHNAAPKLIKIDVQGSEIRVLKGMKNYLSTHSGVMVLAEHDLRLLNSSGFAPTVVYDFMKALDYAVYCHPTVVNRKGALFIQGDEHPREKIATVPCSDLTYWKRNR